MGIKLLVTMLVALTAAVISASSSAADTTRWVTEPSCSATTTTLTCTGKGAGLQRPNNNPLGGIYPPEAAILGQVHYTCTIPDFGSFTISQSGGPFDSRTLTSTAFHNGQTFSIEYSPQSEPFGMAPAVHCFNPLTNVAGVWTRDPNYYDVSVAIGFVFGSCCAVVLLETPIGTVLAQ
jgi:hypothetical protein